MPPSPTLLIRSGLSGLGASSVANIAAAGFPHGRQQLSPKVGQHRPPSSVQRQQILLVARDQFRIAVAAGDLIVAHGSPITGDDKLVQLARLNLCIGPIANKLAAAVTGLPRANPVEDPPPHSLRGTNSSGIPACCDGCRTRWRARCVRPRFAIQFRTKSLNVPRCHVARKRAVGPS